MVGPVLGQRQLSLLVGVQYTDKLLTCSCDAVSGSLHVALLCNAWFDSEYMFCDGSWVLWPCCSYFFYAKRNSDPEVVSVPALRCLGLRVTLNGEVCTVDTSVAFQAGGRTWKLDITSTSPLYFAARCSLFRCCLRSWVDLLGALDD